MPRAVPESVHSLGDAASDDEDWLPRTRAVAERQGTSLAEKVGCGAVTDTAACPRRVPAAKLLAASTEGRATDR